MSEPPRRSLVWDLPTRIFHWGLALSLCGSWATAEAGFDWTETHFLFGYTAITFLLFRFVWGLIGPRHARFSSYRLSPKQVFSALRNVFTRNPGTSVGHSSIGALSAILMMLLVAVQTGTGMFISDDIFYAGPYNPIVSGDTAGMLANIHHTNFTILQVVVVIHILAIAWYAWGKRQNLVMPMLTGTKSLTPDQSDKAIESSKIMTALIILVIAAGIVTLLVQLAPPPSFDDYSF